ncbi:MAG: ABC transporter permease [Acidobacteriota bacterium]|nr:ABC transporter permease [Acidobacteriota bacterium]
MRFVLRMAVRELRASWRRLVFFFACIAVGVGTIVALRSVVQSARAVLGQEARSFMAADVIVHSSRSWTPDVLATLDRELAAHQVTARTESVETPTMARPADPGSQLARVVELRAVQAAYPFYGTVELQGGQPYAYALLARQGALVGPELLTALDVRVGDAIVIGSETFHIRGVITREPGRVAGAFSLGPRVMIADADLPATGLLGFGSRASYEMLLEVPPASIDPLVTALRRDFANQFISVRSYRSSQDRVGRDFQRAENYLSLVGLVVVVLGGIGVSSVMRVFIHQKLRSIAILKCLGARTRQIFAVYLLQVCLLGLTGSLLGVGMAAGAVAAVPRWTGGADSLFAGVTWGLTPGAVGQGVVIGLLVSVLFSLVPLLDVRHARPASILRDEPAAHRRDWLAAGTIGGVAAALVALAVWQAGSLRVGLVVCGAFAAAALALYLMGRLLIRLVRPLAESRWFALRHAVLHLVRPGHQTNVILLAVGLGAFFVIGVRSVQTSLLHELTVQVSQRDPDMFLIDVQGDQVAGVTALLAERSSGASAVRVIPVLQARVTGVKGRRVDLRGYGDVRREGALGREYTITYRDRLEPNERILAGRFWQGPSATPEVSIEQSIHDRFHVDVGDTMQFDVLGRTIEAKVTSIRSVDFRDTRNGGFMFVFRPGLFDTAPHTYVVPLKGPQAPAARAALQHRLAVAFPNVTAIDVQQILNEVRSVLSKVTLAISIVGLLVLGSGTLILIGAVAVTKFQRIYEAAILKTLGASTRTVAAILVLEYGVLGTIAGAVGALGAVGLTWGLSRWAIDIPWQGPTLLHLAGLLLTATLVAVIGVLASADVLRRKPLATLRAE